MSRNSSVPSGGFTLHLSKDNVETILTLLESRMEHGGDVAVVRGLVALFDRIQGETGLSPRQRRL